MPPDFLDVAARDYGVVVGSFCAGALGLWRDVGFCGAEWRVNVGEEVGRERVGDCAGKSAGGVEILDVRAHRTLLFS